MKFEININEILKGIENNFKIMRKAKYTNDSSNYIMKLVYGNYQWRSYIVSTVARTPPPPPSPASIAITSSSSSTLPVDTNKKLRVLPRPQDGRFGNPLYKSWLRHCELHK